MEREHKVGDVYGISRDLPLNYVERDAVDMKFIENLTRSKHIVIFGSSKQGKTSLRKHCLKVNDYITVHCSNKWNLADLHAAILKQVGYEITQSNSRTLTGASKIHVEIKGQGVAGGASCHSEMQESTTSKPLDLDPTDVNDVIRALNQVSFQKYILLEDFHYLPIDVQRDFSVALKAFHEQSKICFIIIGVWLEESRLTAYNGDLTGRLVTINADQWQRNELKEVVEVGEALLNIQFEHSCKEGLLASCFDSVYILQEACYRSCVKENIFTTQVRHKVIGHHLDVRAIIKEVVDEQRGRFISFLSLFSSGFQETTLQMHRWLLYAILTSTVPDLAKGLSQHTIRQIITAHHPEGTNLNSGNLTQALQSCASLQVRKEVKPIILDYDETNIRLNVVDRGFLLWLENQDRSELLRMIDLPC